MTDDLERRIARLESLEAIRRLKYETWRYYDMQDAEKLLTLFASDIRISTAPPASHELRGIAELAESVSKDFASSIASHQGHGGIVDLTSDTTATGYWTIDEWYYHFERGLEWHAKGYYLDEYIKIDGAWKVQSLKVKFAFKDTFERSR